MIDKSCTDPPWMSVVPYISDGDVSKVGYFFDIPAMFKIKSLYSNDLILNIASKSKETVQKLIVDQWKMLKDRIKRSFWGVSSTFFNQLSYTLSYKNIVSLTVFIV